MNMTAVFAIFGAVNELKGDHSCALHRLGKVMPELNMSFASKIGMAVGFTESECLGIMDGWDQTRHGYTPMFVHALDSAKHDRDEYTVGYELGKALAEVDMEPTS